MNETPGLLLLRLNKLERELKDFKTDLRALISLKDAEAVILYDPQKVYLAYRVDEARETQEVYYLKQETEGEDTYVFASTRHFGYRWSEPKTAEKAIAEVIGDRFIVQGFVDPISLLDKLIQLRNDK